MKLHLSAIIYFSVTLFTFLSCKSKQPLSLHNTKGNHNEINNIICSAKTGSQFLAWKSVELTEQQQLLLKNHNILDFHAYQIDNKKLNHYLKGIRKLGKGQFSIPLFVEGSNNFSCEIFKVQNSGSISEHLQKKYPEIITLRGVSEKSPQNTIRLDANESELKILLTIEGQKYFVETHYFDNQAYYIIYHQSTNSRSKNIFE